ncbi:hypothetical protein DRH27_01065 [Candidatus Falkowbacteria bacterium]|nr:MAG: hypothetical protein DRH27_01065 [Candidatus Falkowbacteria bacterium]
MYKIKYAEALAKIKKADNILLVTHDRPDGDALSSTCALIEFLEKINKKYFAYCKDEPPYTYNFLPHLEKIQSNKKLLRFNDYDLIIALDCGSISRTNLEKEINNKYANQYIIEFDHHPKIDSYADIEIKDVKTSSTAEVLYNFFKSSQIKINKNMANCILTGILTDTGNLLYPSTTDTTIKIASEMLLRGANYPKIIKQTARNKSFEGIKIWGKALSSLQINKKYNFAFSVLTYNDIKESSATDEEMEGVSGFLSNLAEVKGLIFLREEKPGLIKGSLRSSHPDIDISKLAIALDGGGHPKSSGFKIKGNILKTKNGWEII